MTNKTVRQLFFRELLFFIQICALYDTKIFLCIFSFFEKINKGFYKHINCLYVKI